MVGIPRLCSQVGHAGDRGPRTGSCRGLGESQIALKAQGPLERFGSDANGGQESPAQLTCRHPQFCTQSSNLGQLSRHQPAHRGRDKPVRGGSSRLPAAQEALQHIESRQWVRRSRQQLAQADGIAAPQVVKAHGEVKQLHDG
jgi:hypothetical protein